MSNEFIYIDFNDGSGYRNVTDYVLYNSIKYSRNAFNENKQYAQNSCSFTLNYDQTLFYLYRTSTKLNIKIERTGTPVFTGYCLNKPSYEYNGILDNTQIEIEANDEIDLLDVEVGDIIFSNCAVCDPTHPEASLVHLLAAIAGFSTARVTPTVSIPTVLSKFAPNDETDSVLNLLSTLLYEYRYSLHMNGAGVIEPVLWDISPTASPIISFTDCNSIDELSVSSGIREFDSVKTIYYELATKDKVKLFTDSNCTYADDGTSEGHTILAGTYYPPEANTIDETTGTNQIVYQEYDDTAIKYKTNKAITAGLDYYYKAFESDFSAIVATSGHYLDNSYDDGIILSTSTYYNKKARLVYRNPTAAPLKIYYNNIFGTVWYRTSERNSVANVNATVVKQQEYTSQFLYTKAVADAFTKALASIYAVPEVYYTVKSLTEYSEGAVVKVTTDDGTDQLCQIMEASWNSEEDLFEYIATGVAKNVLSISKQTVSADSSIAPVYSAQFSVNTTQVTIPYINGAASFTDATIIGKVMTDSTDVTSSWTFTANSASITGTFSSTEPWKYTITSLPAGFTSGSVTITASRSGWTTQTQTIIVKATVSDSVTGNPDPVGAVTARAYQNYIDVDWEWSGSSVLNTISYYQVEFSRDAGNTWATYRSSASKYTYVFNRNTDGYPEISSGTYELDDWRVRIKAVNIYGAVSASYGPSEFGQPIDYAGYSTYVPSVPSVAIQENSRSITVGYSNTSTWYNKGNYEIQVAKGYTVSGGAPVLITDTGALVAYEPAVGIDSKLSYDNYKMGSIGGYGEHGGSLFNASVPLYGQNEVPSVSFDTPYYYRVRSTTGVPTSAIPNAKLYSAWSDWVLAYGRATSAQDVVANAINTAHIVDNAITANKIYVEMLAAISANLGVITDGAMVGNENNLWALSRIYEEDNVTVKYYEGTMKAGGTNQYLHIVPRLSGGVPTGEYDIDFKVGNFTVTAVGSTINGVFEVRDILDNLVYFSVSPDTGVVSVKKQLIVGEPTIIGGNITTKDSMYTSVPVFTGSGSNNMTVTEGGTVPGSFEVDIQMSNAPILRDGSSSYWRKIVSDSSGNVWGIMVNNSCIYKCTFGSTTFLPFDESSKNWYSITVDSNNNVWAIEYTGQIYKCVAGTNSFMPVTSTASNIFWSSLYSDAYGNVWADYLNTETHMSHITRCLEGSNIFSEVDATFYGNVRVLHIDNTGAAWAVKIYESGLGNIYKCPYGSTTFSVTTNPNANWSDITSDPSGNIWASVMSGDIYKCPSGTTVFTAVGGSRRFWREIESDTSGNIWALATSTFPTNRLYKCLSGETSFVAVDTEDKSWTSFTASASGSIWCIVSTGVYGIYSTQEQYRWRINSGTWSTPAPIVASTEYTLTGYDTKIVFSSSTNHYVGDLWTFYTQTIGALSAQDIDGTEVMYVRKGVTGISQDAHREITASTTIAATDRHLVITTADAVTITMPSGMPVGKQVSFLRTVASANAVAVTVSGETIEGSPVFNVGSLSYNFMVIIQKLSSSSWVIISGSNRRNIDGGSATTIYGTEQVIDGGSA